MKHTKADLSFNYTINRILGNYTNLMLKTVHFLELYFGGFPQPVPKVMCFHVFPFMNMVEVSAGRKSGGHSGTQQHHQSAVYN